MLIGFFFFCWFLVHLTAYYVLSSVIIFALNSFNWLVVLYVLLELLSIMLITNNTRVQFFFLSLSMSMLKKFLITIKWRNTNIGIEMSNTVHVIESFKSPCTVYIHITEEEWICRFFMLHEFNFRKKSFECVCIWHEVDSNTIDWTMFKQSICFQTISGLRLLKI